MQRIKTTRNMETAKNRKCKEYFAQLQELRNTRNEKLSKEKIQDNAMNRKCKEIRLLLPRNAK